MKAAQRTQGALWLIPKGSEASFSLVVQLFGQLWFSLHLVLLKQRAWYGRRRRKKCGTEGFVFREDETRYGSKKYLEVVFFRLLLGEASVRSVETRVTFLGRLTYNRRNTR